MKNRNLLRMLALFVTVVLMTTVLTMKGTEKSNAASDENVSESTETTEPTEVPVTTEEAEATPTETPTPEATLTPVPTATAVPTPTSTPAANPTPTAAKATPTKTAATNTPTLTPTETPTVTPTPVIAPDEEKTYYAKASDVTLSVKKMQSVQIDGILESLWDRATDYPLQNVAWGTSGATGDFKLLWDESHLYLYITVKDSTADISSNIFTRKDSVEIFLDESGEKPSTYDGSGQHYLISRDGGLSCGSGASGNSISYKVVADSEGYVVEAAISFATGTHMAGNLLGLDVRVNDSFGKSARDYVVCWSDTSFQTHIDLSKTATVTLR